MDMLAGLDARRSRTALCVADAAGKTSNRMASFTRFERRTAFCPLQKFKLVHHQFPESGGNHLDKISNPCSRKILVADWDVK